MKTTTYKTGDRFKLWGEEYAYVLAQVGYQTYAMISLHNGNRFRDPIAISDPAYNVSVETITATAGQGWKRIKKAASRDI